MIEQDGTVGDQRPDATAFKLAQGWGAPVVQGVNTLPNLRDSGANQGGEGGREALRVGDGGVLYCSGTWRPCLHGLLE